MGRHCIDPVRLGSARTGIPIYRDWPINRMSGIWRLTSIYLQNAKGTPCVSRFGSETIAYAQRLATVSHRFGEIPLSRAGQVPYIYIIRYILIFHNEWYILYCTFYMLCTYFILFERAVRFDKVLSALSLYWSYKYLLYALKAFR